MPPDARVDWTAVGPDRIMSVVGAVPRATRRLLVPPAVLAALVLMFAAFTLYSLGVWSVVLSRHLRPWHAALFWAGLLLDSAGTEIMRRLAGGFHWNLHTATGAAALTLMLVHALWASIVLLRRDELALRTFHRISITVWAIWLVPFVTGLLLGRHRGG